VATEIVNGQACLSSCYGMPASLLRGPRQGACLPSLGTQRCGMGRQDCTASQRQDHGQTALAGKKLHRKSATRAKI